MEPVRREFTESKFNQTPIYLWPTQQSINSGHFLATIFLFLEICVFRFLSVNTRCSPPSRHTPHSPTPRSHPQDTQTRVLASFQSMC